MPTDPTTPIGTTEFPSMFSWPLLFIIIVALVAWIWWMAKRRGGVFGATKSSLRIDVLATRPLGARSHLAIIETGGVRSLIATSAQGVTFLRDLPGGEGGAQSEAPPEPPRDFARHLKSGGEPEA